jgi:hypothetical protein
MLLHDLARFVYILILKRRRHLDVIGNHQSVPWLKLYVVGKLCGLRYSPLRIGRHRL